MLDDISLRSLMARRSYPHLLVFVDGIGLAEPGEHNPFSTVQTPAIDRWLGGPLTVGSVGFDERRGLLGIDACLGIEGLPQSATGQTTLLTGVNAQREIGHHVTALPGPRLRAILEKDNLLKAGVARGWQVTFANPYTAAYLDAVRAGSRRPSVTTCAAMSAGLRLRDELDLARNRAVAWDICRDRFSEHASQPVSTVRAREAGEHLARLAAGHDLTLFETFLTDLAGHGRAPFEEAVARLDALLGGVLETRDDRLTVVVTSDHGNLEDLSTRAHTRNPVPLLVFGPRAHRFESLSRLDEVAPSILESGSS